MTALFRSAAERDRYFEDALALARQLEGPRVGCILAALWALAPAPPSLPDS